MWCKWYFHREEKSTQTWKRTVSQYSSQSLSHPLRRYPFISTSIEESKRSEAQRLSGPNITETWLLLFFQIFCINDFTIRQEGFPADLYTDKFNYCRHALSLQANKYHADMSMHRLYIHHAYIPCLYSDLWSLSSSKSLINFLF